MKWFIALLTGVLLVGLLALGTVRLVSLLTFVPPLADNVTAQSEAARPARLAVTLVTDSSCAECTKIEPFVSALRKQPVTITAVQRLEANTPAGKAFASQYKLQQVPVVVVEGELSRSSEVSKFLASAGTVSGNTFVYLPPPPYRDLATGKIRGQFSVTYLTAASCSSCYEVTNNAIALQNLGVVVTNDSVVASDSTRGRELIRQYKLRYLPTIVLVGDLEAYQAFQKVWPQVGSREADGAYVLRDGVKLMGAYYDVTLGHTVTPPTPKPSS